MHAAAGIRSITDGSTGKKRSSHEMSLHAFASIVRAVSAFLAASLFFDAGDAFATSQFIQYLLRGQIELRQQDQ